MYDSEDEPVEEMDKLQQMIFEERMQNPSQFVSHWEADENDVDEATEEDRKKDPVKQMLWAAETGNLILLNEMINNDKHLVDARDGDGYTPLHRAAYEGHLEAAKFLLKNGADVNATTNDGWTPLHSASFWGQKEVVSLFLRWKDCDINAKTSGHQTPLHLAAQNATNLEIFMLLLMHPSIDATQTNRTGEKSVDIARRNVKFHEIFNICDESINIL